ncbi:MAG: insulinase family protein [Clostridia bacterium]|nr:insulinase family protein [Clostridia bacterium]
MTDAVRYNVAGNINLYVINDKKYKTVYSAAFVHRLLNRDEVTLNSLLSKVLKTGTHTHPSMSELSKYAENLYGCSFGVSVTKRANVQSIVSTVNVVSDRFTHEACEDDAFTLMLDLLFRPNISGGAFPADSVNSQKSNLKDDIDGLINDKRSYANVRCIEEMCKGEPNAIVEIGYAEDIDNIDGIALYKHYESIIHSSPIDVFVVGDVDAQKLCNRLKEYFSDFSFNIKPICVEYTSAGASDVKYIEDNLDVNQGKLVIGLRTGVNIEHPDYYALLTANSIFGSGAHSKLFNNVREKMSLCYYAYSRLDKYNSLMLVGSGIEFDNYNKTKDAVLAELENVRNGNFTDVELDVAKEYIISSYRSYEDNPGLLVDYYMGKIFTPTLLSLGEACEKVSEITRDDVVRSFKGVSLDTVYFLNGKEASK